MLGGGLTTIRKSKRKNQLEGKEKNRDGLWFRTTEVGQAMLAKKTCPFGGLSKNQKWRKKNQHTQRRGTRVRGDTKRMEGDDT